MALIDCPECGKQISDLAKSCPHCGARPTVSIACKECGGKLSYKGAVCPHCGAPPLRASGARPWLIGIAVVAALPSLLALLVIAQGQGGLDVAVAGALWAGFIYLCYLALDRALDKATELARVTTEKARGATHFTTDQVERRTAATEQQVDADTIGKVAGAGKFADESETARKWTTQTDAFGRIVGDDLEDADVEDDEEKQWP